MLGGNFFIDAGDFTCLAGEIVSRRETPSQCGRVRSPDEPVDLVTEDHDVSLCQRIHTGIHYCKKSPGCLPCLGQATQKSTNKADLKPRVSPAFAITYFCNHCNIRFDPIPV